MDVVCGRIYDEYEEAGWWNRNKSEGEVPVVWSEAGGGIGVAGEGVEGSDGFCGIHAADVVGSMFSMCVVPLNEEEDSLLECDKHRPSVTCNTLAQ